MSTITNKGRYETLWLNLKNYWYIYILTETEHRNLEAFEFIAFTSLTTQTETYEGNEGS